MSFSLSDTLFEVMVPKEIAKEKIDRIEIYMTRRIPNRVGKFIVNFYVPGHGSFNKRFCIREFDGNPTEIGRRMGIECKSKRISIYSPKGKSIEEYLHRLARKYAGSLTEGRVEVKDDSPYGFDITNQKPKMAG